MDHLIPNVLEIIGNSKNAHLAIDSLIVDHAFPETLIVFGVQKILDHVMILDLLVALILKIVHAIYIQVAVNVQMILDVNGAE